MEVGKLILNRYIRGIIEGQPAAWSKTDKNVISMSIVGEDPAMLYGILRYMIQPRNKQIKFEITFWGLGYFLHV